MPLLLGGDFFFDPPSRSLTYSGIYRFLNNPERVLGLAGVWGIALITWSPAVFYLATTAHVLNLAFLQFVEKPHVIKVSAAPHFGTSFTNCICPAVRPKPP